MTVFPTPRGVAVAANGVSFDINAGATVGLVGESGSGKSVTCRSILRLVPEPGEIVSGSIVFGGRSLLDMPSGELRRIRGLEISMILQDPMSSLNPVYTIGDQITEPLRIHGGMNARAARAEAESLLNKVGISAARDRLRAYPHELSGGMRQRVMIGIAVSCKPKLLLADEPTTALDVTIQDQILSLLVDLQKEESMALLLVSHDLGVIAQTCDRVCVMYAGYIVEEADVVDLFERPAHPYTAALLEALPEVGVESGSRRLAPIMGQPPDLVALPHGCPFAPRCKYVRGECAGVSMELMDVDSRHRTACPFNAANGPR